MKLMVTIENEEFRGRKVGKVDVMRVHGFLSPVLFIYWYTSGGR